MYYSNGNYEAFTDARKPKDADKKSAYVIGGGLAGLAACVFMIRDGHMDGKKIHLLEEEALAGGSLNGTKRPEYGYIIRGGWEMENHFECLWDMYRSIPSLEIPGASYLDEYAWLDKDDPSSSNCRLIHHRGDRVPTDGQYGLGKCAGEIVKLVMTPEDKLEGVSIEDFFSDEFFETNFWAYWATMFAFEKWHSVIEMRRYAMRFIHHIDGLPDLSALKFNKYNQYESMTKPLLAYLESHDVDICYNTQVENVVVDTSNSEKVAKKLILTRDGEHQEIDLTPDDLVYVTNGSIVESSTYGTHHTPAPITHKLGGSWHLCQNLAEQDEAFGHPEVFSENILERAWFVSATMTMKDATL